MMALGAKETTYITIFFLYLISMVIDVNAQSGVTLVRAETRSYNCKRAGFGCQNGGRCVDGDCQCPAEFTGYNCGLEVVKMNCVENPCRNGGLCYDNSTCFCQSANYGKRCEHDTDTWECLGTEMKISIMVPTTFRGLIYGTANRSECAFTEEPSDEVGFKKYVRSVPMDQSMCSAEAHDDYPNPKDVTYVVNVIVGYHPMWQLDSDQLMTFNCTHPASNVSMEADLNSDLNEREHMQRVRDKKVYSPVRFHFLDKDDIVLQRSLSVGEEFTNIVYLLSTDVYSSILLERCVANSGRQSNRKRAVLLRNGCPTDDGKLVMVHPPGQRKRQYTPPAVGSPLPAVALNMYGFRFYESKRVFIQCVVKICKPEDAALCEVPLCGNSNDNGQPARRKRSSVIGRNQNSTAEEETVTAIFTVSENPVFIEEQTMPGKEDKSSCFQTKEIIIVIIVLSALILLMLLVSVCLTGLIFRSRAKLRNMEHSSDVCNQQFRIPRSEIIR